MVRVVQQPQVQTIAASSELSFTASSELDSETESISSRLEQCRFITTRRGGASLSSLSSSPPISINTPTSAGQVERSILELDLTCAHTAIAEAAENHVSILNDEVSTPEDSPIVRLKPKKRVVIVSSSESESEGEVQPKDSDESSESSFQTDENQEPVPVDSSSEGEDAVIQWHGRTPARRTVQFNEDVFYTPAAMNASPTSKEPKSVYKTPTTSLHTVKKKSEFLKQREALSKQFYEEFNDCVFDNKLPRDLSIEWSPRLTSTAGKAIYTRASLAECKIQLSTKVLDTRRKLRNTLAHEMCHIAVYHLVGLEEPHHGTAFKAFAAKFNKEYPEDKSDYEEAIFVETTHDYAIDYKFKYVCKNDSCGNLIGRFSRSIDITKKICSCGGPFQLLNKNNIVIEEAVMHEVNGKKTLVRRSNQSNKDGTPKKKNLFAEFVSKNFARARQDIVATSPQISHADVMKKLSEEWKSKMTL